MTDTYEVSCLMPSLITTQKRFIHLLVHFVCAWCGTYSLQLEAWKVVIWGERSLVAEMESAIRDGKCNHVIIKRSLPPEPEAMSATSQ